MQVAISTNSTAHKNFIVKKKSLVIPFPSPKEHEFTFIDLFAGIGGFRIPMQELKGKCIFTSEFNVHAQKTYELNFGEIPSGDITKFDLDKIPKHTILTDSLVSLLVFQVK